MNGNWASAALKSVFYTGLLLLLGMATLMVDDLLSPMKMVGLLTSFALLSAFYLAFSLVGWLVIGLPVHWLCSRYTQGHLLYYATLPGAVLLLTLIYKGSWLLPGCALAQACLFHYHLNSR
ncbi:MULTISPECIES: hypothetical protein [unclassified Pseudoalteromonas]|uniref:hypothetical protein n=1 Tax=unclassified Pseudoalteromonas TaxID=194690 RepID=UPI0020983669|nr:hypothetical protein [Pseudoalteromonas sp. XMcav2-N]MCO7190110.1 hypothetical protein [Pseudoalteromonas sp. XMcav2-N]